LILAKTQSNWLKHYLKEQGGALTITHELLVLN
jgi:hypothetical protein